MEEYEEKFACAIDFPVCLAFSDFLNKHGHALIEYEYCPYIFIEKAPRKFTETLCFHQIFSNILWNYERRKRKFKVTVTEIDSH